MAKRNRGSNRPGQRQPAKAQSRPALRPASSLSREEEARAADLESQIVAQERASDVGRSRNRQDSRSEPLRGGRNSGSGLLAVKAAEEYHYLVRDVRRIVAVGGLMIAILAVLIVLIDVTHVITV